MGAVLYYLSPLSGKESEHQDQAIVEDNSAEAEPSQAEITDQNNPTQNSNQIVQINSVEPKPVVMQAYAQKLRELGTCLDTRNSVPGEELEPSLQVLIDSVRGEWGESVINTEDWMQVELQTPEGDLRRIRVEMDFDNETQVQRKLKFMNVTKDGQTSPIPIPEDQAVEPSDSLIASLEAGNKILGREKFERIYFQNGEEIVARQKDGFIAELEVNKGPKTFKCLKLNEEGADCQCIQ